MVHQRRKEKKDTFFILFFVYRAHPLFLTHDDIVPTISLITAPPTGLIDEQQHLIDKTNTYSITQLFRFYQMHTDTDVPVLEQYYFWQLNSKDI